MNVNKSHKKSPPKVERNVATKPIERVPTKKLIESIKRDIEAQIQSVKQDGKSKGK